MSDPFGFGSDLACGSDLDPMMREVEGLACFAQDLVHRLNVPRGGLVDDPDYGTDARDDVGRDFTPAELAALPGRYASELAKDDRVLQVKAKLLVASRDTLQVQFFIVSAAGPFRFTVDVGQALAVIKEGSLGALN
jgi:hypothetical protein